MMYFFSSTKLDKLSQIGHYKAMKSMAVGDLKTHFSQVLDEVRRGKKVGILYGRAKKPVAMIVPYGEERKSVRKIGILDGKAKIEFSDNFKMSAEELLNL